MEHNAVVPIPEASNLDGSAEGAHGEVADVERPLIAHHEVPNDDHEPPARIENASLNPDNDQISSASASERHGNSAEDDEKAQPPPPRSWKATWKRFGPLSGLFCLFLPICGIFASLGVLVASNNALVANWQLQPSAYIAVFTAIANQSVRYASLQGVAIAWWSGALNGGTLGRLHRDWDLGTSIWSALAAGHHTTFLGLGCIMSTVVAIDGVFLQRASTVHSVPIFDQTVPLSVSISPELPEGWSGVWATANVDPDNRYHDFFGESVPTANGSVRNNINTANNPPFDELLVPYLADQPLTGFIQGCESTCSVKIKAPALAVTACTDFKLDVNYTSGTDATAVWYQQLSRTGFFVWSNLLVNGPVEVINFVRGYSKTTACAGHLYYAACSLQSAVGEYDVLVSNGTVTTSTLNSPNILALANNSAVRRTTDVAPWTFSTLAGVSTLVQYKYFSAGGFDPPQDGGYLPPFSSAGSYGAWQYMTTLINPSNGCPSWNDPGEDTLRGMNQLMFRAGVHAAKNATLLNFVDSGLEFNTTIDGRVHGQQSIYKTNFYWFLGAVLVELLCIGCILPTYMGWWKLGRPVSFSPLEIAKASMGKAFDAPLLADCNSNSSGDDVVKALGKTQVKYGATGGVALRHGVQECDAKKIAFANPEVVYRPLDQFRFEE